MRALHPFGTCCRKNKLASSPGALSRAVDRLFQPPRPRLLQPMPGEVHSRRIRSGATPMILKIADRCRLILHAMLSARANRYWTT
jgi:hypothetical protein